MTQINLSFILSQPREQNIRVNTRHSIDTFSNRTKKKLHDKQEEAEVWRIHSRQEIRRRK